MHIVKKSISFDRLIAFSILQYSQTEGNVITIVLSTVYTTGWVGIGFSKDGMMLNSSCMAGWVNVEGRARIKQYHVEGYTPSAVKPDKGELPLTSVPPYVALNGAAIYLAFQLKYPTPLKRQPILLAYSRTYPQHHHLSLHDEKTTVNLDFSSGWFVRCRFSRFILYCDKKSSVVIWRSQ